MRQFRKTFILILLLISVFILIGCSNITKPISFKESETFKTLNEVKFPSLKVETNLVQDNIVNHLNAFAFKTSVELFKEDENYIYSPLSLYMALSMLLEGVSKEEAKLELEGLLGFSRDENRGQMKNIYQNNFYKNKGGMMRLANSIWFRNNYPIEEDYLKILGEDYYAETYQTNFDSEGHQNIIDWINYYTENFLELTKEKFSVPSNTVILLLNTIYFDNKWAVTFDKKLTQSSDFLTNNGDVQVEFMRHTVKTRYKDTELYKVAEDYFENNNSITYILPKEGVDLFSLLALEVLIDAIKFENDYKIEVDFSVPKFKYFSEYKLNDALMNLGVNEVFLPDSNSLDLMANNRGLFVSEVKQNAGIEFSEAGVKAAAVTGIIAKESASDKIYFNLNRPFIYIIKDGSGIPLFIGIVQNPKV